MKRSIAAIMAHWRRIAMTARMPSSLSLASASRSTERTSLANRSFVLVSVAGAGSLRFMGDRLLWCQLKARESSAPCVRRGVALAPEAIEPELLGITASRFGDLQDLGVCLL